MLHWIGKMEKYIQISALSVVVGNFQILIFYLETCSSAWKSTNKLLGYQIVKIPTTINSAVARYLYIATLAQPMRQILTRLCKNYYLFDMRISGIWTYSIVQPPLPSCFCSSPLDLECTQECRSQFNST